MSAVARPTSTDIPSTIDRLQQSLADLLYAVEITPPEWLYRSPWRDPAAWSVAQNLAHMAVYEEQVAAPILEALAAGTDATDAVMSVIEGDFDELWQQLATEPIEVIAERFQAARSRQIHAVAAMTEDRFHLPATTLWSEVKPGIHSAAWVAAKTFQHTWDHGNAILQVALFAPR
jgi:DinB superfamily